MVTLSEAANWILVNSESLRNLSFCIVAIVGLPFLVWRSSAANKSANASLSSAQAALKNSSASLARSEAAAKQSEVAIEQSKLSKISDSHKMNQKLTELLANAYNQLGSDVPIIRIGAIKILDRISEDSSRDYYSIMDTLLSHIKQYAYWSPEIQIKDRETVSSESVQKLDYPPELHDFIENKPDYLSTKFDLPPDIQTALTVIGQRKHHGKFIDFKDIDLHGAKLNNLDLNNAFFTFVNFTGARFIGANLTKAKMIMPIFNGAMMADAILDEAQIESASFRRAILNNASFLNAKLSGVQFDNADLTGVNFRGVDLSLSLGLTRDQLLKAQVDEYTQFPKYLKNV